MSAERIRVRVTSEYEIDAAAWTAEYDLGNNTVPEDVASYLTSSEYGQDFTNWHQATGVAHTVSRRVEILPTDDQPQTATFDSGTGHPRDGQTVTVTSRHDGWSAVVTEDGEFGVVQDTDLRK